MERRLIYIEKAKKLLEHLNYLASSNFTIKEAYEILNLEKQKILRTIRKIKSYDEEIGKMVEEGFSSLKEDLEKALSNNMGNFSCMRIFKGKELDYIV